MTAEGRVDFRELVKDLAGVFRMRIELRQIGVRDETKMMGGIGCCGRDLCCHSWLPEFEPVSIKMAKVQNLSLNPIKISGICGRLMCCLQYENDNYVESKKGMPEIGEIIGTRDGKALVCDVNILKMQIKARLILNDNYEDKPDKLSTEYYTYSKEEISRTERRRGRSQGEKQSSSDAKLEAEAEKLEQKDRHEREERREKPEKRDRQPRQEGGAEEAKGAKSSKGVRRHDRPRKNMHKKESFEASLAEQNHGSEASEN